jgi:sodium/bile acid cotransporter 7
MRAAMENMLVKTVKKYWFIIGLLLITAITVADSTGSISQAGKWLKSNGGPSAVILLIFFISGLMIRTADLRSGVMDSKVNLITLLIIFIVSPAICALFIYLPIDYGIRIGLILVAVMPTTLSSGIVMTGAAGGNMAQSLYITILANALCAFTIPIALSWLLSMAGPSKTVHIDKLAITIKILVLVLLPLSVGMLLRMRLRPYLDRAVRVLQSVNQLLILVMVWMAVAQSRLAILNGGTHIAIVLALSFTYHGLLLAAAWLFVRGLNLGPGRRESVVFMGGQKTLTLSVLLQMSLFPEYGLALTVCVLHHIVHLIMDGYMVERLKASG